MNMKMHFHFVNISCGMFHDVTSAIMEMENDVHAVAAYAVSQSLVHMMFEKRRMYMQ